MLHDAVGVRWFKHTFLNGSFFDKDFVPASNDGNSFSIPHKPRSTKDAHDLALDRISANRRNDRRNAAYSNDIMAYDHETVDSFVKERDNKPRFAWVIRSGVDRSRDSKLRKRYRCIPTTKCNRVTPPSLEERKERSFRNFCFCFWFNETQSPRSRRSTIIDRYRVVISSNAIEVFRNDVVCFSSILRLIVNYVVERIPRFTGKISKWQSIWQGGEGWLRDGKWDKLDRWKKDIAGRTWKKKKKKTSVKR